LEVSALWNHIVRKCCDLEIVGGEASQLNDFCFRKLCSDNRGLSGIFDEVGRRKLALYLLVVVDVEAV
jgi:hypothetical protein